MQTENNCKDTQNHLKKPFHSYMSVPRGPLPHHLSMFTAVGDRRRRRNSAGSQINVYQSGQTAITSYRKIPKQSKSKICYVDML